MQSRYKYQSNFRRAKSIAYEWAKGFAAVAVVVLFIAYLAVAISGPDLLGQEDYCNSPMGYRDVRCVGAFTLPMRPVVGR
jgi:hypothetical protein